MARPLLLQRGLHVPGDQLEVLALLVREGARSLASRDDLPPMSAVELVEVVNAAAAAERAVRAATADERGRLGGAGGDAEAFGRAITTVELAEVLDLQPRHALDVAKRQRLRRRQVGRAWCWSEVDALELRRRREGA